MTTETLAGYPGAWRAFGTGPRHLFALHCSLAHAGAWSGLAAALGHYRVTLTAMDLPGHGNAGPIADPAAFEAQTVAMAVDLLERQPGPVPVIGHSFGGVAAMRLGLERPDLVERLVLIEPVLFALIRDAGHPGLERHDRAEAPFWQALAEGQAERAARLFLQNWGTGEPWEALPERQRHYIIDRIGAIGAGKPAIYDDNDSRLRLADVARIAVPVMLVEGAKSPPMVSDVLDCIQSVLPGAGRATIDGAHHMAPITHAAEVARATAPFLSL